MKLWVQGLRLLGQRVLLQLEPLQEKQQLVPRHPLHPTPTPQNLV
jgi:hypothetical protein